MGEITFTSFFGVSVARKHNITLQSTAPNRICGYLNTEAVAFHLCLLRERDDVKCRL